MEVHLKIKFFLEIFDTIYAPYKQHRFRNVIYVIISISLYGHLPFETIFIYSAGDDNASSSVPDKQRLECAYRIFGVSLVPDL